MPIISLIRRRAVRILAAVTLIYVGVPVVSSAAAAPTPAHVWAFGGLAGRDVLAVAESPSYAVDGVVFAGTDSGVFRSSTGGDSWAVTGLTKRVIALAVSPEYTTDQTVFALVSYPTSYGVARTTNGGASWTEVTTISGYNVLDVAVSPDFGNDDTVFVGRMKSLDGGDTWNPMGLATQYVYSFAISPGYSSDGTLFAGTDNGVMMSTDRGASWTPMNAGLTNTYINEISVSPAFATDNTLFAGGVDVFRSIDGGATWTKVRPASSSVEYVSAIETSPGFSLDQTIFVGTNEGLFKSADAGTSWTAVTINSGLQTTSVRSVSLSPEFPSDAAMVVGVVGGIFTFPNPVDEIFVIVTSTGWSDPTVGTWDGTTNTATLTTDLDRAILVDGDGIALEGGNHQLAPAPQRAGDMWNVGVFIDDNDNAKVKNFRVDGYAFGIAVREGTGNSIADNTIASGISDIWLTHARGNIVSGNTTTIGIDLLYSDENTVTGNDASGLASPFTGKASPAISLTQSDDNTVSGNSTHSNEWGINLAQSDGNTITGNTVSESTRYGISVGGGTSNLLKKNSIEANPGTGVGLGGTGNELRESVITGNGVGVEVTGVGANKVTRNTISSSASSGIRVYYYTSNNEVSENDISRNGGDGIQIGEHSTTTLVLGNTIAANSGWGLYIWQHSNYTWVLHNNFLANAKTPQAVVTSDTSGTTFNNPAPVGGNYWSDWTTPDLNGDWFVDAPYVIGNNQDALPWAVQDGWNINRPPTVITPIITPEPSFVGGTATVQATFSDPEGLGDGPFTCTIDHGDGTGAVPGTVTDWTCEGTAHTYETFGTYTVSVTVTDKDGGAGASNTSHVVVYNFGGFLEPTSDAPELNTATAGSVIPVRFSLFGDGGPDILEPSFPASQQIDCQTLSPLGPWAPTTAVGKAAIQYDPETSQYLYRWQSNRAWSETCRVLLVRLVDGTDHEANFAFR